MNPAKSSITLSAEGPASCGIITFTYSYNLATWEGHEHAEVSTAKFDELGISLN